MKKWKYVPNWEGLYLVSTLGEVRSADRRIRVLGPWGRLAYRNYRGRTLKARKGKNGYPLVCFTAPGRKRLTVYVHDLVLLTFRGPKPLGMECCHRNGKRDDPRLANLRYGTRSSNSLDRHKHGTVNVLRGPKNPLAKLTDSQVAWIRRNHARFSRRHLGRKFGVSHGRISAVIRGESYLWGGKRF